MNGFYCLECNEYTLVVRSDLQKVEPLGGCFRGDAHIFDLRTFQSL